MSVGGPGTWPTVAAAVVGALDALTTAVHAVVDTMHDDEANVPVVVPGAALDSLGWVPGMDIVGIEPASTARDAGTMSPTRREQHTIRLDLSVCAFRVTTDESETTRRAWAILAAIDEHIRRADPDLGHEVLWAGITTTTTASGEAKVNDHYSGRASVVLATIECGVIVAVR